jgi:hypothetical protein
MAQDLSIHHGFVGPLFRGVKPGDSADYELRREQIDFFHEHGYLSGIRILSDEQVEALRQGKKSANSSRSCTNQELESTPSRWSKIPSKDAQQVQNHNYEQDSAQSSTRVVAPSPAIRIHGRCR